jgi:glycosyltransferase involved in cell wall biosynthesis
MKVALITRSTLYSSHGGDTIQVLKTVKFLRRLNVMADIKLTHEKISYNDYDLLHFFSIIRPADILPHLKKTTIPFVVTPLLIDYSEFDKNYRNGISRKLFSRLSTDQIEYVKTIARWLKRQEQIRSLDFLVKGQHNSIKKILEKTAVLLPNTQLEYDRLINRYSVEKPFVVVPNGIDTDIFFTHKEFKKDDKMVLCVARTEGLKNQLTLIKALKGSSFQLFVVGNSSVNQQSYFEQCKKEGGPNVHFIRHLTQPQLIQYYQRAKVHVLASWFETCGLSSLEAASMQCNLVVSDKGYVREYFGDSAFYCDPALPSSIRTAVEKAASLPACEKFQEKIFSNFTWQKAAYATYQAYQKGLQL